MSDAPEKIYMQFGKDAVLSGSWCTMRIDNFNTEYIRADLVDGMREALEAALAWIKSQRTYLFWPSDIKEQDDIIELLKAALEAGKVDG